MTTGVNLFSATVISVQVGARTLEKDLEDVRRREILAPIFHFLPLKF